MVDLRSGSHLFYVIVDVNLDQLPRRANGVLQPNREDLLHLVDWSVSSRLPFTADPICNNKNTWINLFARGLSSTSLSLALSLSLSLLLLRLLTTTLVSPSQLGRFIA